LQGLRRAKSLTQEFEVWVGASALGRSWSLPTLASRSSTSDLAVTSVGQRVEAEADETGRDDPEQQRPVIGVGELAERTVQRDRGIRVEVDRGLDQGVTDQNEDDSPRDITENTEPRESNPLVGSPRNLLRSASS